ncbi:hypothetical protein C1H46_037317 [Malus baccata]|uniref:Pentacotripeptide-repeat region of PRORP domain-containing protein n=1 Tax=Malus baccata TaxID=106549 RepID=A0A540KSG4_MALBA|nr:hypothetical protein C1H46_037317 [Malus baccata]
MPQTLFLKPFILSAHNWSKLKECTNFIGSCVVCTGMLAPRKFLQKRKKVEAFKDAADEADQKNWRRLMNEIEKTGSAVSVLKSEKLKDKTVPKDVVLGTLVRFKQLKKWILVSQILEWLQTQNWLDFSKMDFLMLMTAYGKQGHYTRAEKLLRLMNEKGRHPPSMQRAGLRPDVVSYALLISAYGKARREEEALALFEEMLDAGVRPTRKAYNILLHAFAVSGMVEQARTVFKSMRRDRYAFVFFFLVKHDMPLLEGRNNIEKMMERYEEMLASGIKPNQTILTTIMDAYGKSRDFGSAVVWYQEMESCRLPPDQKAKNILLSLAKTAEEQKVANQLVGNLD